MTKTLPDLQAFEDHRNVPINKVGIKGYYHPIYFRGPIGVYQHTRGIFEMTTTLGAKERGTHMSRFVALLGVNEVNVEPENLLALTQQLTTDLNAQEATIQVAYDLFVEKNAPESKVASLMNYEVIQAVTYNRSCTVYTSTLRVPVATLCPCSKALSKYNAHNQRCYITLTITNESAVNIVPLIQRLESKASCSLFALLKRPDEKWVTEMAFETPKFVEDLVRDIALDLHKDNFKSFQIDVENIESIHNHSAIAQVLSSR